jgi:hypothetical protein
VGDRILHRSVGEEVVEQLRRLHGGNVRELTAVRSPTSTGMPLASVIASP